MSNEEKKSAQNIQELYKNSESIRIPAYQRAFSWEEKHCSQYLNDLLEQKGKKYYLGQFIFEKEGNTLFIIDGQQRLTTTIIFLSVVSKILMLNGEDASLIRATYLTDVFKTIEEDQVIFKKVTQKHLISSLDSLDTISQKRIIEAYNYFETELMKIELSVIKEIQSTLENAVISTYFIYNKIEATQIFEYQNNRGKGLSRFEVVKAYLMHQVYIHSTDVSQANIYISDIQKMVALTYRHMESVEGYFSENEILDNFCSLFFNIAGTFDAIKEKLNKETNKTVWINLFFENFVELTLSAKTIVNHKNDSGIMNLFFVGNNVNWKLVLLTLFYKGETTGEKYNRILKLLEILCFKLKLGDYRTDYLPSFSKRYFNPDDNYNIDNLYSDIRSATEIGFKGYWNHNNIFTNIISAYFDNQNFHYHRRIKFVLWQYENHLRSKNRSGIILDKELFDNYTIEHIKPQTPIDEVYTKDFENNYLHRAGNMALLTQSQNSRFGNKSFKEKSKLFQDTALCSYTEIREKTQWTENEIEERHKRISDFAKMYFGIVMI